MGRHDTRATSAVVEACLAAQPLAEALAEGGPWPGSARLALVAEPARMLGLPEDGRGLRQTAKG
jgi:hypothetical protein